MNDAPLVSVGIPTFNRELLIERAVKSILAQEHANIEVVISDNCSTDSTPLICQHLCAQDARIRYIRQPRNVGATRNFDAVLERATGEYFMWLGDDDHVDPNYISTTLRELERDPAVALASGVPRYYRSGALIDTGRKFSVEAGAWWSRVAQYYWKVSDNGAFYGLMRTSTIRSVTLKNVLGCDWLAIACVAASGKVVMLEQTGVHRELGGASQTLARAARALGLPRMYELFPYVSIAANAFADVVNASSYARYGRGQRRMVGALVFLVLLARAFTTSVVEALVLARNSVRRKLGTRVIDA